MRIDFHGLILETPCVSVYLWTPWRASALEHRLFDAVRQAAPDEPDDLPDERRLDLNDTKTWRAALQAIVRVLKGWQEEAEQGRERRAFRWLMESDCDAHGYDSFGEPVSLWLFLQLGLEHGGLEDGEKSEMVDLEGFGLRVWPARGDN